MSSASIELLNKYVESIIDDGLDEFKDMNLEQIKEHIAAQCSEKTVQRAFDFSGKAFNPGIAKVKDAIAEWAEKIETALGGSKKSRSRSKDVEMELDGDENEISINNDDETSSSSDDTVKPVKSDKLNALLQPTADKEAFKAKPAPVPRVSKPRIRRGYMIDENGKEVKKPTAKDIRIADHIKSCKFVISDPMDVSLVGRNKEAAKTLVEVINKYTGKVLDEPLGLILAKDSTAKECVIEEISLKSNHLAVKCKYMDVKNRSHSFSGSYGSANPSRRTVKEDKKSKIEYNDIEEELIDAFEKYAKGSKINSPFDNLDLLKTDYIYDLKNMEIDHGDASDNVLIDYLNNIVLTQYAIGYSVVESEEYIYRRRNYNHLFDFLRIENTYNGTINKQVIWNVYQNRHAIIYHDKYSEEIEDNWNLALEALKRITKDHPERYDKEKVKIWKVILSSKQCYNVICRGYPATTMFEKGLKDLITDLESIKLFMGPLFLISPIFTPYAIYCKDMVTTKIKKGKKDSEPVIKPLPFTTTYVANLIKHVTLDNADALNYDDCIWTEGLNHLENFDLEKIPDCKDMHSFRCLVTESIVKKQIKK